MSSYTIGLDLGQSRDYTALVAVEHVDVPNGGTRQVPRYRNDGAWGEVSHYTTTPDVDRHHHVVHAQRFELGTPYPEVVREVAALMDWRRGPLGEAALLIDKTGVGAGVFDLFREAYADDALGRWRPVGITITGGEKANGARVPKLDLVAALQAALQQDRLKIADGLPAGEQLRHELARFRIKVSQSGHARYEAEREADHDDLAVALMLAIYNPRPKGEPRWQTPEGELHEKPSAA